MKKISAIAQTFILTSFSALSLLAAPAQAASFRGLGFLDSSKPNIYSSATGVSADGSVIVGESGISNSNETEAFRWTQESGIVGLGFLTGSNSNSRARSVSADGSVIVGGSQNVNGEFEAFRWTQERGMIGLGFLPLSGYCPSPNGECLSSGNFSDATSVSADGSIIVGGSHNASRDFKGNRDYEAFRWTQESGIVGLGFLPLSGYCPSRNGEPCPNLYSNATGVSTDGSTIIGEVVTPYTGSEPFVWTQENGLNGLGGIGDGRYSNTNRANGVSADGSVTVGWINRKAFRWIQVGDLSWRMGQWLDDRANPDEISNATGVSADASYCWK